MDAVSRRAVAQFRVVVLLPTARLISIRLIYRQLHLYLDCRLQDLNVFELINLHIGITYDQKMHVDWPYVNDHLIKYKYWFFKYLIVQEMLLMSSSNTCWKITNAFLDMRFLEEN